MNLSSAKEFNDFLRDNALWLALAVAGVIVLIVAIALVSALLKRSKDTDVPKRAMDASTYLEALGGEENVLSHKVVRSRIVLELKDYSLVDKEKLKEAGVDGFIMMSNKLTLVIPGDAEKVNTLIFHD